MRHIPFLPAFFLAAMIGSPFLAQAQTYFFIDQITVAPPAPTDQDEVYVHVSGNLSSSGSFVASATASVTGSVITLTIIAQSTGGLAVLVPHTEAIDLGQLSAGSYTLTVAGAAVDDAAPAGEHSFTVTGGSATVCDSLDILNIGWSPFSDTALVIHVFNPTTTLFDYPSFVLLDANGDTLAEEQVTFFGIGQESWHTLTLFPGAVIPSGPFTGTLELWTLFGQQLACSWNMDFNLCPPEPCAPLNVYLQNMGGALTLGSFHYTVRHLGDLVASGIFNLSAEEQYDSDSLCLPPGNYLMEVVPDQGPTGGQPYFGVNMGFDVQGPSAPLIFTTMSAVAFNFYGECAEGTQGIAVAPAAGLLLGRGNGTLSIARTDGAPVGELRVLDAQGRLIAHVAESSGRHVFATSGWTPGFYLVQTMGKDSRMLTARTIVQ